MVRHTLIGIAARAASTRRRAWLRRDALAVCALAALPLAGCGSGGSPGDGHAATAANPIQRENAEPGSERWQFWRFGDTPADDVAQQIKGYASATSVAHTETLTLFVSVSRAQRYTIDVYRIGWYAGAGGRLVVTIPDLQGTPQRACPLDPTTGLIACDWAPAAEVRVPDSWTTGIYLAVLHDEEHFASFVPFVVRDDGRAPALLYQQSVTTYQAYNLYPDDGHTGKNLYGNSHGARTLTGTPRAVAVSFDRPYAGIGAGDFLRWEIHLVRWLERSGYDVGYSTDVDTHERGARLLAAGGFISAGHDEYWSRAMYDAVEAARDAGVHLAFLGANAAYWQVRFAPSASGVPDRVMLCFKDAALDPVQGPTVTVTWRDPLLARPEQRLIGEQYTDIIAGGIDGTYADYVVADAGSWVYAGTGLAEGDRVPGIVGYETDRTQPEYGEPAAMPGTRTCLARSPFRNVAGVEAIATASVYRAPSGAWVFAAGTIGWSLGLDDFLEDHAADPRIQRMTANVLDAFQ